MPERCDTSAQKCAALGLCIALVGRFESNNSRSPSSRVGRRVCPLQNKLSPFQDISHNLALYADALAMDDAYYGEAFSVGLAQVFFDDGFHLFRRNRVQIENVCDFDHDRFRKWVVVFFE